MRENKWTIIRYVVIWTGIISSITLVFTLVSVVLQSHQETKQRRLEQRKSNAIAERRKTAPRFFRELSAGAFAQAVNHFVSLGESASIQELKSLCEVSGFRTAFLCRVLYEGKEGPIRPPGFGGLELPVHTMPYTNWPIYPVAHSGSSYFVLGEDYMLGGIAEEPEDYVDYCHSNGVFRTTPIPVPTRDQAIKDAIALRESQAWKAIQWTDASGLHPDRRNEMWSYEIPEESVWDYILEQAQRTSAASTTGQEQARRNTQGMGGRDYNDE